MAKETPIMDDDATFLLRLTAPELALLQRLFMAEGLNVPVTLAKVVVGLQDKLLALTEKEP